MASLKDLKNRIKSVKSTQKITKAMKVVAAAKLKRAQDAAVASRPYTQKMSEMLAALATGDRLPVTGHSLLSGTGQDNKYLIIVATSNRGLAGAFNSSISRAANNKINSLVKSGKDVKIICIGKKGYDILKRSHKTRILEVIELQSKNKIDFTEVQTVATKIIELFGQGEFDVATIFYNKFQTAISQTVTEKQLVPLEIPANENKAQDAIPFEFEPNEEEILNALLPRNLAIQIFSALLENLASEHGARMTAMDNATRNAGEMIQGLTLVYNRTRQAAITKELIEIISGAEAI